MLFDAVLQASGAVVTIIKASGAVTVVTGYFCYRQAVLLFQ